MKTVRELRATALESAGINRSIVRSRLIEPATLTCGDVGDALLLVAARVLVRVRPPHLNLPVRIDRSTALNDAQLARFKQGPVAEALALLRAQKQMVVFVWKVDATDGWRLGEARNVTGELVAFCDLRPIDERAAGAIAARVVVAIKPSVADIWPDECPYCVQFGNFPTGEGCRCSMYCTIGAPPCGLSQECTDCNPGVSVDSAMTFETFLGRSVGYTCPTPVDMIPVGAPLRLSFP